MKIFKLFLVLVAITSVTFYSCSDSSPIENQTVTQKSVALRTVLTELKSAYSIAGRSSSTATPANPFCFEFVFPITFSYNNGTAISVATFDGLMDILGNESPNLFLEGIVFPFQVVNADGTTVTVNSENEFTALIQNCGFTTFQNDLENSYCFDIVFPIQVSLNGQLTTINSIEELHIIGDAPGTNGETVIVFPINVIHNNQTVVIHNLYEFYAIVDSCGPDPCICTQEYAPVCVQTPNGIIEFGNMCYAICAGYTQNDLVSCTPITECSITNLSATPGDCDPVTGGYSLTINFNSGNTTATHFEVWSGANALLGVYPIASLPITIANYPTSVLGAPNLNFVTIKITENNEFCTATQQFTIPNCGGVCTCPPDSNPVCVQSGGVIVHYDNACLAECDGYTPNDFVNCNPPTGTFSSQLGTCFTIAYPVVVQSGGALVTVLQDGQLLQYVNPISPIPIMNYPITVTFLNPTLTATFNNQVEFETAIENRCN